MTDRFSKQHHEDSGAAHVLAWLLFPISLFPLAALVSYDWRSVASLNTPPMTSANWIGALGDAFAYYGYLLVGLSIWIVPLLCVIAGVCLIRGRKMHPGRRELWFVVFLVSVSCILQVIGSHENPVSQLTQHLNLSAAGGVVGYLLMTRCLAPLLSDFGSSVMMAVLAAFSLVAAIGVHNLIGFFTTIIRWATVGLAFGPRDDSDADGKTEENPPDNQYDFEAVRAARAAAREAARAEKQRIKDEKKAAKAVEKAELEAARAAVRAARERDREQLIAEQTPRTPPQTPPPPPPQPRRQTVQAPAVASPEASGGDDGTKGPYVLPPISLLNKIEKSVADHSNVNEMSKCLIDTLKIFNVDATLSYTIQGPVVTKYAIELAPGTRYSAVTNISSELMGALRAKSLRIEAPIPGEDRVGIEVPNIKPAGISFREIIESSAWRNSKAELPLLFGKDAAGKELVADLASMPHMLVAGATGQGKSVCLNAIINGFLMTRTPEQLKLIMVDPKSVEFASYAKIPHLLVPVITNNRKVVFALHWAVAEMEKRLAMFARVRVRNIRDFNSRKTVTQPDMFGTETPTASSDLPKTVPYIVIIIDEVADLMSQCAKDVVPDISRLAAKARAAGIHLLLATQRPDAKVITGTIKANIPGRVAFKTSQAIDSRTILDESGAENLIGKGDMLYKGKDGILIRAQGAWISDEEITRIGEFIEEHCATDFDKTLTKNLDRVKDANAENPFADLDDAEAEETRIDPAEARAQVKASAEADDFKKAVECVINTQRASTSHFQRQLGWGYNHAAKILDMLAARGIVSSPQGLGARQIIMDQDQLVAILNGTDADASATDATAEEQTDAFQEQTDIPSEEQQ